jgi:hypothetical protein
MDDYASRGYIALVINLNNMNTTKVYGRGRTFLSLYDQGYQAWSLYTINNYIPLNYVIDPSGTVQYGAEGFSESTVRAYIEGYLPNAVEEGSSPSPLRISSVTPNPTGVPAAVWFSLTKPGAVSLRIYSTTGQLLRTLVNGTCPAGVNNATWDLRDNFGRPVANGIYYCELSNGAAIARTKVSVLR